MTAIDELYQVQNGVDDVVDTDHNTLVDSVLFLNDAFGGTYNYGNGRDGNLKLGAISPNASTAPTCIAGNAGSLTGTFYYKYSVYNLSGETTVSSASSAVAPSAQKVTVTIPAFGNNTNVTGFYLYRSADNVTYYRVAFIPVDDATQGATYVDNLPITSGTAPQGSNTTGTSVTTGGTFYAKSVNIPTGTITLSASLPYLVILCQGDVTFGGTISGAGVWTANSVPEYVIQRTNTNSVSVSTKGIDSSYIATSGTGSRIFLNTTQLQSAGSRWIFKQGSGGVGGIGDGKAGGTVFIAAKGALNVSTGTITLNGANGGASQADGGGAGGICVLSSSTYINRTGVTISANGGNGSTGTNNALAGASGGGGGIVVFVSDYIIGSATVSVNGGSAGATNPSGNPGYHGAVGGGCGGDGGAQTSGTNPANAGSAGISLDTTPRATSLSRLG